MGFEAGRYPRGDTAFNYFAPEELQRVREHFGRVFAGEDTGAGEYILLRRDGTRFHGLLRSRPVRREGKVGGARGFIVDISALKEAKKALQASERKFTVSIHNNPCAFSIFRFRDGVHLEVNDAACRLYGYSREEIVGRTSKELGTWVDRRQRSEIMALLKQNGSVENFATRFRCKSGEIRHGVYFGSLIEIDGEPCVLAGSLDVTDLHNAKEALRVSEERLRVAVEGAKVGLWDWDIKNGKAFCNETYYRMRGYDPGDHTASYESWLELIHPDDRARAAGTAQANLGRRKGLYSHEYRMRRKDGSYAWILDYGRVAERDVRGRATRALGIHIDISERKNLEQVLEQRVAERTAQLNAANQELKKQIRRCRAVEASLRSNEALLTSRSQDLSDSSTALKVLLKQQSQAQQETEKRIMSEIRKSVLPYLSKLRAEKISPASSAYLDAAESNLKDVVRPLESLPSKLGNLTTTEANIADLIIRGVSTKQIADSLKISPKTVEFHRYNLRRKLGIANKKVNLRAYLSNLK